MASANRFWRLAAPSPVFGHLKPMFIGAKRTKSLFSALGLSRSRELKILGLFMVFFLFTTVVLSALVFLERRKTRLAARVNTRDVGCQAPTTFTHTSPRPRFRALPDFAND